MEMKSLSYSNTRDIRQEIKESLEHFDGGGLGGQGFDYEDELRFREMAQQFQAMQEGTDLGPNRIEYGDDLETMYSKMKKANMDIELF